MLRYFSTHASLLSSLLVHINNSFHASEVIAHRPVIQTVKLERCVDDERERISLVLSKDRTECKDTLDIERVSD